MWSSRTQVCPIIWGSQMGMDGCDSSRWQSAVSEKRAALFSGLFPQIKTISEILSTLIHI